MVSFLINIHDLAELVFVNIQYRRSKKKECALTEEPATYHNCTHCDYLTRKNVQTSTRQEENFYRIFLYQYQYGNIRLVCYIVIYVHNRRYLPFSSARPFDNTCYRLTFFLVHALSSRVSRFNFLSLPDASNPSPISRSSINYLNSCISWWWNSYPFVFRKVRMPSRP